MDVCSASFGRWFGVSMSPEHETAFTCRCGYWRRAQIAEVSSSGVVDCEAVHPCGMSPWFQKLELYQHKAERVPGIRTFARTSLNPDWKDENAGLKNGELVRKSGSDECVVLWIILKGHHAILGVAQGRFCSFAAVQSQQNGPADPFSRRLDITVPDMGLAKCHARLPMTKQPHHHGQRPPLHHSLTLNFVPTVMKPDTGKTDPLPDPRKDLVLQVPAVDSERARFPESGITAKRFFCDFLERSHCRGLR